MNGKRTSVNEYVNFKFHISDATCDIWACILTSVNTTYSLLLRRDWQKSYKAFEHHKTNLSTLIFTDDAGRECRGTPQALSYYLSARNACVH